MTFIHTTPSPLEARLLNRGGENFSPPFQGGVDAKLAGWFAVMTVAVAVVAAAPANGAESGPLSRADYRLNVTALAAFRLAAAKPAALASNPRDERVIPASLADKPFARMIHSAAKQATLDPALVHAVIFVESRYNPAARSPKGAIGLMQVLSQTAARYGVRNPAASPEANLAAGTRYLRDLMQLFQGRLDLVLAAYNAGENAVLRHGHRIPPYRETQSYVPAVLAKYREWRDPAQRPEPPAVTTSRFIEYLPGTRLDLSLLPP